MRMMIRPPAERAPAQAQRAAATLPRCMRPEGVGANRPTTGAFVRVLSKASPPFVPSVVTLALSVVPYGAKDGVRSSDLVYYGG